MSRKKNVKILDCTLRDGGFCLEDAFKYGIETEGFSDDIIQFICDKLIESNLDYIEIGAVELSNKDKTIYGIKKNICDFSQFINASKNQKKNIAVFFRGPDIPLDQVPNCENDNCGIIRLCVRYSELEKSIEYCKRLKEKGYAVSIQPMVTVRYTEEQLKYILDSANEMNAFAVYIVDSYGYLTQEDVLRYFNFYNENLKEEIKIGFHGHNNMYSAFSNAKSLIEIETSRNIIIDSCIMGMGQGAGNLQTELIVSYLNGFEEVYDFGKILDVCDYIESIKGFDLWGYSVDRLLPAIHKVAYKYSFALHHIYGMKFREIDKILHLIPEEMKYRYTLENVEKLLNINKKI